jgi:hypothetical protein
VAGETTYCTIVNRGIAPQLTITKVVDNGSTTGAQVSDFRLFAGSIEFTSGVPQNIDVGTYTISEMGPLDGYVGATVCAINNTIVDLGSANELTLGLGDSAECVVLNVKDIPDVEVPSDPATTTATTTCATTPTAAGCGSTGTTTATTTATSTPDATGTTTPTTTPEVTTPSTSSSGGGGNGKRVSLSDGNGGGGNGGGNDTNPQGEVLGASTGGLPTDLQGEVKGAVAPAGAPNTGFGGMSSRDSSTFTYALLGYFVLAALFGVWVVRRTAVNG